MYYTTICPLSVHFVFSSAFHSNLNKHLPLQFVMYFLFQLKFHVRFAIQCIKFNRERDSSLWYPFSFKHNMRYQHDVHHNDPGKQNISFACFVQPNQNANENESKRNEPLNELQYLGLWIQKKTFVSIYKQISWSDYDKFSEFYEQWLHGSVQTEGYSESESQRERRKKVWRKNERKKNKNRMRQLHKTRYHILLS